MKVLQHLPDNADALLAAAMACMGKGEYREAKEYLVRGRRVRPTDNDFRILLAKANRMGGRYSPCTSSLCWPPLALFSICFSFSHPCSASWPSSRSPI
jgi:hypothetical protein